MLTHNDYHRDSYPANKRVLGVVSGAKGHLLCRIYWATNLKDGICRMGLTRLGDEIGSDRSTISRAAKWLTEERYIVKIKDANLAKNEPPHYKMGPNFYAIFDDTPVAQRNTPVAQRNTPVAQRNTPVAQRNTPVALCNKDIDTDTDTKKESNLSLSSKTQKKLEKIFNGGMSDRERETFNFNVVQYGLDKTLEAYQLAKSAGANNLHSYAAAILRRSTNGQNNKQSNGQDNKPNNTAFNPYTGEYVNLETQQSWRDDTAMS